MLSNDEFRERVQVLAREAAVKHYQRGNPTAPEADGLTFAGRHWQQFIDVACDILALWECLDQDEAAPSN